MTSATELSVIDELVLVRLLAVAEKGESSSKIKTDLKPLLAHRWTGAALDEVLDGALDRLEAAGLVATLPGQSRRAAPRVALTAEGRRRGLEFLGVGQLRPKTTWGVLRKTYLPAVVLGLPASTEAAFKGLGSDPIFKAVLLKQQYELPTTEIPKLDDAIDALAWKLIGFEGETRKFNPKNVKTAVLNRALGDGRATDFKKAASRLVAQRAGARRDDPKELRDAVVRAWIDRTSGPAADSSPAPWVEGGDESRVEKPALPAPPAPAPALDLPAFAERVQAAARACPSGRYGDNKVFIAHVWRMVHSDPDFAGMDLDTFKRRLGEANNARCLVLARADLVQTMDSDDVGSSEVHYLNTTFHFIRI